jgi:thiol-disulfide isomerase/thioredoxin
VVIAVVAGGGGEPADEGTVSIDRAPGPALAVGEAVPQWSAPALDGSGTISWSDYVGKPTVLSIWASWCPHCQAELPRLAAALESHPDIQIVTVTTAIGQQPGPTPQGYLDSEGLTFPVAKDDGERTLMGGLGVESFPTTYFVGSDGKVLEAKVGEVGLLPDGTVDPSALEAILATLEQS